MSGFSKLACRTTGTVAAVLLLAALPSAAQAQTDDEARPTAPSVSQPARPPIDTSIRHHGGGDDDQASLPAFRDDRGPNAGMRLETTPGTGLALDSSSLPGEMADTPEGGRALFDKPSQNLSIRPDPWTVSPKP